MWRSEKAQGFPASLELHLDVRSWGWGPLRARLRDLLGVEDDLAAAKHAQVVQQQPCTAQGQQQSNSAVQLLFMELVIRIKGDIYKSLA